VYPSQDTVNSSNLWYHNVLSVVKTATCSVAKYTLDEL